MPSNWKQRSGRANRGETEFDQHFDLEDACEHLRAIARTLGPSRIFVHLLDGTVIAADESLPEEHPI